MRSARKRSGTGGDGAIGAGCDVVAGGDVAGVGSGREQAVRSEPNAMMVSRRTERVGI